jgi:hypothetical protein
MQGSTSPRNALRARRGRTRAGVGLALTWTALTRATSARACPKCAEGIAARAEVWSADFGFHLFAMLLPLCIIALVAYALERLASRRPPALDALPAAEVPRTCQRLHAGRNRHEG